MRGSFPAIGRDAVVSVSRQSRSTARPIAPRVRSVDPNQARRLLLACFIVSGLTAILYQTVWMRLALAQFGVNITTVAAVLTVFMLGLALGTILAGRFSRAVEARLGWHGLRLYALAELTVGIGGWTVPFLFHEARGLLLSLGPANSGRYSASSVALICAVLLPFCAAMGATFPLAVSFLARAHSAKGDACRFSALYLANVLGGLAGALGATLFLIEAFGFRATSLAAAALNAAISTAAFVAFRGATLPPASLTGRTASRAPEPGSNTRQAALFLTGLCSMGMEVLWTRIYPLFVGTFVYSFAGILATYLVATAIGSALYRRWRHKPMARQLGRWWPWICVASFLPFFSASMWLPIPGWPRVAFGLAPFCGLLGFVTPALVDREAGDDPRRLGRAYGLNLLGCMIGPLLAAFLAAYLGSRWTQLILAMPLFALFVARPLRRDAGAGKIMAAIATSLVLWQSTTLVEEQFPKAQVLHDSVATVIASGEGRNKHLYVNGVGMTGLVTVTKMMAHFPAAHCVSRRGQPLDALVICFGMGTTFRSLASWDAKVTAVELVPSVPRFFGYYFADGPALLASAPQRLSVVIDDGRRYLDRSSQTFDLIAIDPPPPVEAASSSLLYSKEFYGSALRRLKPNGILHTWLPYGDPETVAGVLLALLDSFPHVRVFQSIYGRGQHFLASREPILSPPVSELLARMPEAAIKDMVEWDGGPPSQLLQAMLSQEIGIEALLPKGSREKSIAISDDRAVNEFFFMRRFLRPSEQAE